MWFPGGRPQTSIRMPLAVTLWFGAVVWDRMRPKTIRVCHDAGIFFLCRDHRGQQPADWPLAFLLYEPTITGTNVVSTCANAGLTAGTVTSQRTPPPPRHRPSPWRHGVYHTP